MNAPSSSSLELIKSFIKFYVKFVKSSNISIDITSIEEPSEISDYEKDELISVVQEIKDNSDDSKVKYIFSTLELYLNNLEININNENFNLRSISETSIIDIDDQQHLENFKGIKRNFLFADLSVGAFIPIKFLESLCKNDGKIPLSQQEKDLIQVFIVKILLYIGKKAKENPEEATNILESLLNEDKSLLIYNGNFEPQKAYSFLYTKYILSGHKTLLTQEMTYTPQFPTSQASFQEDKDFSQFFEILDVWDEFLQSNDILSKFLRLYQIIEYLLIRILLVKIQTESQNSKIFLLRRLNKINEHEDFDKNLFKELFTNSDINGIRSIFNNYKPTLKTIIDKDYTNTDFNQISEDELRNILRKTLYKLRNSIVHNKESEQHITIHILMHDQNLLKFIIELLKTISDLLWRKILNFDPKITYSNKYIKLY